MDTPSMRARRVAHGAEYFAKRASNPSYLHGISSATILRPPKSGEPIDLQEVTRQLCSRVEGERKAAAQVVSAVTRSSGSITSQTNIFQKIKRALSDFFVVHHDDSREATVSRAVEKLKSKFGDSVPNFQSVWANRKENSENYRLMIEFSRAVSQTESIEFLRAVDDFRRSPSIDKADKILQIFIEPDCVDDFGIPIADPSKMQVNLQSEAVRKELLSNVGGCIKRAESGDPQALTEVLAALLPVETYVVTMIKINLDTVYRAEITNQARQKTTHAASGTHTGSFA